MRRIIQSQGAEVIHLGHNRSVEDVVRAALQEDADAVAISSYQGGHLEYFKYMVDMLKDRGAEHIRVFGGGGGTITPEEGHELQDYGVERIYHPNDGMHMGLAHMIEDVVARASNARDSVQKSGPGTRGSALSAVAQVDIDDEISVGRMLSALEDGGFSESELKMLRKQWEKNRGQSRLSSPKMDAGKGAASKNESDPGVPPVIGITGTGGAGKSSVVDELLLRFLHSFPEMRIAVLAVDPTRRKGGGALLGDRIRVNSLRSHRVFMRSMATRRAHVATNAVLHDCIAFLKSLPFDLVIVETAGIGQADTEVVDLVDFPVYVMTSDYGAASQLEKIDMLDYADLIVLNKSDKRNAQDSLRDVRKQWRRNHPAEARVPDADLPVFPTIASRFNDPGVNRLFAALCGAMASKVGGTLSWQVADPGPMELTSREPLIPGGRVRYLAEIAQSGRGVGETTERQVAAARRASGLYQSLQALQDAPLPAPLDRYGEAALADSGADATRRELRAAYNRALEEVGADGLADLKAWPARARGATEATYSYKVREREITGENYTETLSRQRVPKIAVPRFSDWGEVLRFIRTENLPGYYPYTGGVYP
ncbi:MAG: cobalamin-dependent protein, partial [Rhodanobacteraceae bacterium]